MRLAVIISLLARVKAWEQIATRNLYWSHIYWLWNVIGHCTVRGEKCRASNVQLTPGPDLITPFYDALEFSELSIPYNHENRIYDD